MAIYKIQGSTAENSNPASNLIIAYKADRNDLATMGEELGRTGASVNGSWDIEFEDWDKQVFVVALDPTIEIKYKAKIKDWVIGILQVDPNAGNYPEVADEFYNDVALLLHFDEGFTDYSLNQFVATTETGTADGTPYFGSGSFDSDSGWLTYADAEAVHDLMGDYTFECWVYPTSTPNGSAILSHLYPNGSESMPGVLHFGTAPGSAGGGNLTFSMYSGASWTGAASTWTPPLNTWSFIRLTVQNDNVKIYAGGSLVLDWDMTAARVQPTTGLRIGHRWDSAASGSSSFVGFIDDVRLTNAVRPETTETQLAAWPNSRFVPGKEPTILDPYFNGVISLVHFEGDAIDEIPDRNWVLGGAAAISAATPKYGVGCLSVPDGLNTLSLANNLWPGLGSDDFTVELWIEPAGSCPSYGRIFQLWDGDGYSGLSLTHNDTDTTALYLGLNTDGSSVFSNPIITAGVLSIGSWNHVALTRLGDVFTIWVNGVSAGTKTFSGAPYFNTAHHTILGGQTAQDTAGATRSSGARYDDLRITAGTARYTADFTPPTEAFPNFEYDPFEILTSVAYPLELDPYFDKVVSLMHFQGVDGSTNICDEKKIYWANPTLAVLDDINVWYGSSSLLLDGTNYLSQGVVGDYDFLHNGTEDYTVEMFIRPSSFSGSVLDCGGQGSGDIGFSIYLTPGGNLDVLISRGTTNTYAARVTGSTVMTVDTWHHVAAVVYNGVLETFLNGVPQGTSTLSAPSQSNHSDPLNIGRYVGGNSVYYTGNLAEFRITRGFARYLSSFTPPDVSEGLLPDSRFVPRFEPTILDPYPDDVVFLNQFEDAADLINERSYYQREMTSIGIPVLDANEKAYGLSSLYLNGSSYLTLPNTSLNDLSTTDFTIEAWVYCASPPPTGGHTILGKRVSGAFGWALGINDTDDLWFRARVGGAWSDQFMSSTGGAFTVSQWVHVAVVREGSNWRLFIDGAIVDTATNAGALDNASTVLSIGRSDNSGEWSMVGYIDDLRITKVARYTSEFTPSHTLQYDPAEVLPNYIYPEPINEDWELISLLLTGDNFLGPEVPTDESKNNRPLTVVGTVLTDLTTVRVGTGSINLVGSGNSLAIANTLNVGLGDFTVEFWIYFDSNTNYYGSLFQAANVGVATGVRTSNSGFGYRIQFGSDFNVVPGCWSIAVTQSQMVGAWHHIVWQRRNNQVSAYYDGVKQMFANGTGGTYNVSEFTDNQNYIGAAGQCFLGGDLSTIMDEVIVTERAKYFEDFTPSAEPIAKGYFEPGTIPTILDPHFDRVVSLLHFDKDMCDVVSDREWRAYGGANIELSSPVLGDGMLTFANNGSIRDENFPAFGVSDFTIEGWITEASVIAALTFMFDTRTTSGLPLAPALYFQGSSGALTFASAGNNHIVGTVNIKDGSPHHFALCRANGTTRMFIDGVQDGSDYADTNNYVMGTQGAWWGTSSQTTAYVFNGKLDELRVTRAARYVTDFAVPTSPFPNFKYDPNEVLGIAGQLNLPVVADPLFSSVQALYHFDGEDGDTSSVDSSRKGRTPEFYGVGSPALTEQRKRFGNTSLHLASTDWFEIPAEDGKLHFSSGSLHTDRGARDFTCELWLYRKVSGAITLFSQGNPGAGVSQSVEARKGGIAWTLDANDELAIRAGNLARDGNSGYMALTSTETVPLNEWVYLELTVSDDQIRMTMNDVDCTLTLESGSFTATDLSNQAVYQEQAIAFNAYSVDGGVKLAGADNILYGTECWVADYRLTFESRYSLTPPVPTAQLPDQFEKYREATVLDPFVDDIISMLDFEGISLTDFADSQDWTAAGNAAISNQLPYLGKGCLDTSTGSSYITKTGFDLSPIRKGDFTIEYVMWGFSGATGSPRNFFDCRDLAGDGLANVVQSSQTVMKVYNHLAAIITGTSNVCDGNPHHICTMRRNGMLYLYVDGVVEGTPIVYEEDWDATVTLAMSATNGAIQICNGYFDQFRFTAAARYDGPYDPEVRFTYPKVNYDSQQPLERYIEVDPYYENNTLLLPFNGVDAGTEFTDESQNSILVSVVGTATTQVEEYRFGISSGYFNGTTDYLTVPYSDENFLPDVAMTWEAWVRIPSAAFATEQAIFSIRADAVTRGYSLYVWQQNIRVTGWSGGSTQIDITGVINLVADTWHHLCWERDEDGVWSMYVDGVLDGSATESALIQTPSATNSVAWIGSNNSAGQLMSGYMDDFRITKGRNRYGAAFTPPNASHEVSRFYEDKAPTILHEDYQYVQALLCKGRAGGVNPILESSGHDNAFTAVGTYSYDIGEAHLGENSIALPGSGTSYLRFSNLETHKPFTIEGFINMANLTGTQYFFGIEVAGGGAMEILLYHDNYQGTSTVRFAVGGADRFSFPTPSISTWHHWVITHDGTQYQVYLDGVSQGTYTRSSSFLDDELFVVGADFGAYFASGHLSQVRFTAGKVLYTGAGIEVPTSAFSPIAYDPYEAANPPSYDLTTTVKMKEPTAYFKVDPSDSTTVARDFSDNQDNTVWYGSATEWEIIGGILPTEESASSSAVRKVSADAPGAGLLIPRTLLQGQAAWSFSCFLLPTDDTAVIDIISNGTTGSIWPSLSIGLGGTNSFSIFKSATSSNSGAIQETSSSDMWVVDELFHLAVTWDNVGDQRVRFYKNGELVWTTTPHAGVCATKAIDFIVGGAPADLNTMSADITDIATFDYQLSDDDVREIYEAGMVV